MTAQIINFANYLKPVTVPVKSITITRAEGPSNLCGRPRTFDTFAGATMWMHSQGETFPKDGGYDKHDFKVVFADGEEYSGRLDCKHPSCSDNDLDVRMHILSFCEWYAGQCKVPHCGNEQYQAFLVRSGHNQQEYADFINKYLR